MVIDESPEKKDDFVVALLVNWSNNVCSVVISILFNTVWKEFNVNDKKLLFPSGPSVGTQLVSIYFKEVCWGSKLQVSEKLVQR